MPYLAPLPPHFHSCLSIFNTLRIIHIFWSSCLSWCYCFLSPFKSWSVFRKQVSVWKVCLESIKLRIYKKYFGEYAEQMRYLEYVYESGEAVVKKVEPATLLKKRLWHRCFPVNFAEFLRTPFFTEHLWWLLLNLP